ncbi:GSCOCG00007461001-RA-CDS [Cotesia congregata]|uniref:RNA-binding protein NOB1 n=1 Tax=Cotesia congregata TaxID=51543 RepID=A0A8J2H5E0_COTCN|nr:GSCOCG00007461001-RA-CDS [Cotesia congregata]CAG5073591.1 Similar to NOB1: RNA-binding protein NOB1 (Homo sapiens) [Cotesia congregata]
MLNYKVHFLTFIFSLFSSHHLNNLLVPSRLYLLSLSLIYVYINYYSLQEVAVNAITEESVTAEVKSKRQLRRLIVLPYDLQIKDVDPEHVKTVTEFAKKTGDYKSLSSTDIKVIALTLQLHIEKIGKDDIKSAPTTAKTLPLEKSEPLAHPKCIAGFFNPKGGENSDNDSEDDDDDDDDDKKYKTLVDQINSLNEDDRVKSELSELNGDDSKDVSDLEQIDPADLAEKFKNLDCNAEEIKLDDENHTVDEILAPVKNQSADDDDDDDDDDSNEDYKDEDEDEDSDEAGWITPSNIVKAKKMMDADTLSEEPVKVACMTTDFAMQNVLMQMGMHVAALDGRVIKQLRTFIFRCHACYKKTSRMDLVFCPNCGLKTLKKVAVSVDENGVEHIHINYKKQLPVRGKRFSLPTPKGGKHAVNPILSADQPVPDQRVSKLARMKNNPLNDDYIAGYSPFVTRDVFSKSAMLGIRSNHAGHKYWMKKNPNECKKKRK